jgi:biofilm PGA synthesis N-glycosyltransferase PgaC
MRAIAFLQSLDATSLIQIFWYTVLFEIPRYAIGTVVVLATMPWWRAKAPITADFTLSIVLAGNNEAKSLRSCVASLAEQTFIVGGGAIEVIIVDDGSTDQMFEIAQALRREGRVDEVLRLEHRGGKSAAINLGLSACTGEIIVISDLDTTFDRDAFAQMLSYFGDPRVGAVCGNLGVRNTFSSLLTCQQAIEYAISISLGRNIQDSLGMLTVVSGAFGAFRWAAIEQVGRQDTEVGEDADLTLKLRRAGWSIRFASDAYALTDVPETVSALIAQRLRWDRSIITIWMRKFRGALDPRQSVFRFSDVAVFFDVIVFQILLALVFPIYLGWLYYHLGELAWVIIAATLIVYFVLSLLSFAVAQVVGAKSPFSLILYLPLYILLQLSLIRLVRIVAFAQELIFRSSYRDSYVPARVMSQVEIV